MQGCSKGMIEIHKERKGTNLSCIVFPRLVYRYAASVEAAAIDMTPITEYTATRDEPALSQTSDEDS